MTRLLCCALILFAGCAMTPGDNGVLRSAQFEDIPVPRGATYRNSKELSYSYRTEHFRCGQFHYHYDGTVEAAERFFRDTMVRAPYNWKLVAEDSTSSGSMRLVFTKDYERCTVDVDYVPGTRRDNIPTVLILLRLNYKYH